MDEIEHLRQSIEELHECHAAHEAAVPVSESFQDQPRIGERKVYAVLEVAPVVSAVDAARAAIVAEHRGNT